MRRWLKWTLGGIVLACALFAVVAGIGAYYFLRHLETSQTAEAAVLKEFDSIKAKFPERAPLVEIVNATAGEVRLNKLRHPENREASTLHILTWEAEGGQQLRSDMPLWVMRFSTLNVLSKLGITPGKYRLVVQDLVSYGPGIVSDYRRPGETHVLIWLD